MSMIQNHQINVLIVDPNAESRSMVHECMLADGYGCRAVATAPAAIECVRDRVPDLLVCEMDLGWSSGLELYAQVRKYVECPVVFISESRDATTVTNARQAGATYCLSKPLDPTVLMELVDKALWMPHLVRRHVDAASHPVKAPTFSPTSSPANTAAK